MNTLRLWSAEPIDPIRLDAFNAGDHIGSLSESNRADALTRVLYPADASPSGQELRLRQEYFFSSAALQDILRRHLQQYPNARQPARQGRDPAQRHASGGLRRRADAAARRRPRTTISTKPGTSPSGVDQLHQPHPAARGARKLAGAAVRGAAAAPHADRLRDQRRSCCARRASGTGSTTRDPPRQPDRRERRAPGAHGQPRLRRRAFDQRRLGAAHRADEGNGVRRPARHLPEPDQQQDQRHHAAPLARCSATPA